MSEDKDNSEIQRAVGQLEGQHDALRQTMKEGFGRIEAGLKDNRIYFGTKVEKLDLRLRVLERANNERIGAKAMFLTIAAAIGGFISAVALKFTGLGS